MAKKKTEDPFWKLDGMPVWYSKQLYVSPTGKLSWPELDEPTNTDFEIKKAEKEVMALIKKGVENPQIKLPTKCFRASLTWDNLDVLAEKQKKYREFMKGCQDFVKLVCPEAKEEEISYPIREKGPTEDNPDREVYWVLNATLKEKGDRKPRFYHALLDKEMESTDRDFLNAGCQAAIVGGLTVSRKDTEIATGKWVKTYYVRLRLNEIYHVGKGEGYGGRPKYSMTEDDLSDWGVEASSPHADRSQEEGSADF